MRKIIIFISILAILVAAIPAMAVSLAGERYINQIVGGSTSSLRRASQSIYNTELTERAVLDVLAEKLLQVYNSKGNTGVDAVAWACKALGRSGDIRYKNVLSTVATQAENRKIQKYAKKSLKMMPSGTAEKPYKKGTVNLAKMRKKLISGQSSVSSCQQSSKQQSKKSKGSLSIIKEGMSMQEVVDLVGEPTSSTSHITGKTFNPFYYGTDHTRLIYLYKGKGRVFFSQRALYSNSWRVMEVQIDSSELGYP